MNAKIKKLSADVITPHLGSSKSAGYDIHAFISDELTILPHTTTTVQTGFCITPPEGYFVGIFARSGLATKEGVRPANCVAVCDEDYTGEYMVPLHNDSNMPRTIYPQDRIAQMVFLPYLNIEFDEVDNLETTERGSGGFGSTGI